MNRETAAAQVNVLTDRARTKGLRVPWTPSFVFLDADGAEHHRFIGFLPAEEFRAQVVLARAKEAFQKGRYEEARRRYADIVYRFPASDAAPESVYWTGVCDFKISKDLEKLYAACRETARRYPNHVWGKKLAFVK